MRTIQMANYATFSSSPNPYIPWMINNLSLIITLNQEKKDWMKKYHKIIWRLEIIADIQIQIQDLIKLANAVNNQLANIGTVLLQASETHKM